MSAEYKGPWSSELVWEFLASAQFPLRLACVGGDGFPRVVSVWYLAEGNKLHCVSHRDSQLVKLLARNERVGFEVAPNEPPYHGVRGQGTVHLTPLADRDTLDSLLERYLGGTKSSLANWLLSRREEELVLTITLSRIFSWDYRERMSDVQTGNS